MSDIPEKRRPFNFIQANVLGPVAYIYTMPANARGVITGISGYWSTTAVQRFVVFVGAVGIWSSENSSGATNIPIFFPSLTVAVEPGDQITASATGPDPVSELSITVSGYLYEQ